MPRIVFAVFVCGWVWPQWALAQTALEAGARRPRPLALSLVSGARGGAQGREAYGMLRLSVDLEEPEPPPEALEEGERRSELGLRAVQAAAGVLPRLARETVAAALRAADHAGYLSRLKGLARRSRSGAYLPELRLQVGTRSDTALRMTPTLAEPGRFAQADSRDLWFETRLSWRLDRLAYSHDELAIERLNLRAQAARQALTVRVLAALESWLQARLAWSGEAPFEAPRASHLLATAQAAAQLEVMTEGWFGKHADRLLGAAGRAGRKPAARRRAH